MSVFIIKNLKKSFVVNKNTNVVLDNINLEFPDKGLFSIVGKSGCGKSTLLNILMGIEKPSSGKVLFCGKDITKFNDKKFSMYHLSGVSLIFQHYNLFDNFTALDNVILPLLMSRVSKHKSVEKANALFDKFNIQDLSKRNVKNLSGGEKQRIAILRSIITEPKVLLCDEPTGALDSKNSREIMGILCEISKKTLVIMVSHNKELVNEFSDKIIELKNGKIVSENYDKNYQNNDSIIKLNKSYSSGWTNKFLKTNFKKNIKKNLFSILACLISFSAMFVSVGFSEGSSKSQEDALNKNLSLGFATASKSEFIKLENSPLTYEKTSRPSPELIDKYFSDFETIHYEENLSYLFSSFPTCYYSSNKITNFDLIPVYDLTLTNFGKDLLEKGTTANGNFDEILVNKEFVDIVGEDCIGNELILSNEIVVNYLTRDEATPFIKDVLSFNKRFIIKGIVKEFSFLNNPKIFYSYKGAKEFFRNEVMEETSKFLGKKLTFYDYLEECKDDDPVTSYSCYLFVENENEIKRFNERVKELTDEPLQITSKALETQSTYKTFISSFSGTLVIFTAIAFIGINFILGMISLSTFLENRKNTAILTCLGARNKSIHKLYLTENYFVVILSLLFSLILSIFLEKKLNPIFSKKFGLENLITIPFKNYQNVPYGLIVFITIIAIVFTTIFTLVPMIIYRKNAITDELRDE